MNLVLEVLGGFYKFLHFGIPCGAWSSLAKMNGSSRSRGCPDGVRPLTWKEHTSLVLAERSCVLALLLHIRHGVFTIENPAPSTLFLSSPMVLLAKCVNVWAPRFDQCCYGLRPPYAGPAEFIRKSTIVWSNRQEFLSLERRCPGVQKGQHEHVHALGNRKSKGSGLPQLSVAEAAGHYPVPFCLELARCTCLALSGARRPLSNLKTSGERHAPRQGQTARH